MRIVLLMTWRNLDPQSLAFYWLKEKMKQTQKGKTTNQLVESGHDKWSYKTY